MKVYIVKATGATGSDKQDQAEDTPVKAFRSRENAQAECDRLNGAATPEGRRKRRSKVATAVGPSYEPVEVEIADEEVESYASLQAVIETARAKSCELAEDTFRAGCRALFAAHDKLRSFGWVQYTPHYCDGEPCYFERQFSPDINGTDGLDIEDGRRYDEETDDYIPLPRRSPEYKLQAVVEEFLDGFDPYDLGELFGGSVRVTVHRNGRTETDDYDHFN